MDAVQYALTRGVEKILPSKEGLEKLLKKDKITIYQGFDPSSPNLHLGNFIGVRKLAQFQQLGHKVIFLIGDFTGMIGDPTDKTASRKKLTKSKVLENAKDYQNQISRILKFTGPNKAEIKYNSHWLSKLNFEELIELASNFSVQQMLERDFFQQRIKKQKPIYLHEFLYPLMQGYDCVHMNVDLEIGGSDQLFNMLAGRTLLKILKNKEKFVLTTKLLEDSSGLKMGKSEGNTIDLSLKADDLYGKIMTIPDNLLASSIELMTDLPLTLVKEKGPLEAKKGLAYDIVFQLHGKASAQKAQDSFEKTFQENKPDYQKKIILRNSFINTIAPFTARESASDAKRYILQGSVDVNEKTITNPTHQLKPGDKIKIGKTFFGTVSEK